MKQPASADLLTLIVYLLISGHLFSQSEPKGIHQVEWESYQQFKSEEITKLPAEAIQPLNHSAIENRNLNKTVFGYLPYWQRSSAPQYFQYNLLSHIAVFAWGTSPTGILSDPGGWPGDWSAMINNAHKYGVKVVMCVVEFDADDMHILISSAVNRLTFIENVISEIRDYNLDGVNIDFEGPKYEDRGAVINQFMSQLTDSVHNQISADCEVSFAGPAINWGNRWNLAGLAGACDYIFIMGYSFWGSWSATAGPTAPLEGLTNSVTSSVLTEYGSVVRSNPEKLILGVPYYGNRWETQNSSEGSAVNDYIGSVYYATGVDLFRSQGRHWSSTYKVPWASYYSGGKWYQAWCDDDESLNLKYNLVTNNDLLGSGMWALGYDSDEKELWNLLANRYYKFPEQYIIADFEDTLGVFYTNLTYSGTTSGISSESAQVSDPDEHYSGIGSMRLTIKDDPAKSGDWIIRVLASSGNKFLNRGFSPDGRISLFLKTSGNGNKEIAITVDDMAGGTEASVKLPLITDNNWHEYSWNLGDDDTWHSFYRSNGIIDGPIVSLDAILLYSNEQSEDWILNIDAVGYESVKSGIEPQIVEKFSLKPNYPNPFNGQTKIEYSIFTGGNVSLKIFNIRGQLLEEPIQKYLPPGNYTFLFSSADYASGVYIYQLNCDNDIQTGKMTILK